MSRLYKEGNRLRLVLKLSTDFYNGLSGLMSSVKSVT